jgi:hypothetical protein
VAISIEASLPGLYKEASFLAVRDQKDGLPKYYVLGVAGDGTVLSEVIGRYLAGSQEMDDTPTSPAGITPANYKFRFAGEVSTGGTPAYIYRITPKRRRPGVVSGEVWMESQTGAEIMLTGRIRKLHSLGDFVSIVRETRLRDGFPYGRITHVAFAIPNLGPAELVITEAVLQPEGGESMPSRQFVSAHGSREVLANCAPGCELASSQ